MSTRKLSTQDVLDIQGQVAVTLPNGTRQVFKNAQDAQAFINAHKGEGYNVYDMTKYARNYDPEINERYNSKERKLVEGQQRLDDLKDTGRFMLEMTPVIGDALDYYNTGEAIYNIGDHALTHNFDMRGFDTSNYTTAGLGLLAPFIPNIIERPARALARNGRTFYRNLQRSLNGTRVRRPRLRRTSTPSARTVETVEIVQPEVLNNSGSRLTTTAPQSLSREQIAERIRQLESQIPASERLDIPNTPPSYMDQDSYQEMYLDILEERMNQVNQRGASNAHSLPSGTDFEWDDPQRFEAAQEANVPTSSRTQSGLDPFDWDEYIDGESNPQDIDTFEESARFFDAPTVVPTQSTITNIWGAELPVDFSGDIPKIDNIGLFDFSEPWFPSLRFNSNNSPTISKLAQAIRNHPTYQYIDDSLNSQDRVNKWLEMRRRYNTMYEPVKLDNGWTIDALTGNAISPEGMHILPNYGGNNKVIPQKPYHYTDDYVNSKVRRTSSDAMDKPVFTKENFPGQDRNKLFWVKDDVTSMAHFNIPPEQYQKIMTQQLEEVPHGGAVGFSSNGDISTSSAAMFPLQLVRGYDNGTLGMVFNPIGEHGNRVLRLNTSGRMYTKTPKGLKAVPGTESYNFKFSSYNPNNLRYTPNGNTSVNPTRVNKHQLKPAVPLVNQQDWVDWFNETRVKPLNERLKLTRPNESFPEAYVDERGSIFVPNMAGVKLKYGGNLQLKNTNIIGLYGNK